ncbi:MAG: putative cupin superfamily sugar epimerase [Parvibaculaceae bacterium]
MKSAEEIIARLGLAPHPEGGHFRETYRDSNGINGRAHSTAIYYLLKEGEASHWHRVDAVETWHWYAGAPLRLRVSNDGESTRDYLLSNDIFADHTPQVIVPKSAWQSAHPTGAWTLVGCTVAPGFEFDGFEMAPDNWEPTS